MTRIIEIYNAAVPTRLATADTEPIAADSSVTWFRRHNPRRRPLLLDERNGQIVGWLSLESFYERPAYDQTVEISLYIDPDCQGKGIGREMLGELLGDIQRYPIRTIIACIFSHNRRSIRLFQSFSFERWGVLPNIAEMDGQEYSLDLWGKRVG